MAFKKSNTGRNLFLTALFLALAWQTAFAGPVRDALEQRRAERLAGKQDANTTPKFSLPAGVKFLPNVSYGDSPMQRFDVYLPAKADKAPVIFMVHGGAWSLGDKTNKAVTENKVKRWTEKGLIVVSVNYRMLPELDPVNQANDVARALAAAQEKAAGWGGDGAKFVLMGHSAGAHLVAMLAAAPAGIKVYGVKPWLGTVSLDSAALDLEQIMRAPHPKLYDRVFGRDPAYWRAASPLALLAKAEAPLLAVCSTKRDDACPNARNFQTRAKAVGMRAELLEQAQSHEEINENLGKAGAYTDAVETFMVGLDGSLAAALR